MSTSKARASTLNSYRQTYSSPHRKTNALMRKSARRKDDHQSEKRYQLPFSHQFLSDQSFVLTTLARLEDDANMQVISSDQSVSSPKEQDSDSDEGFFNKIQPLQLPVVSPTNSQGRSSFFPAISPRTSIRGDSPQNQFSRSSPLSQPPSPVFSDKIRPDSTSPLHVEVISPQSLRDQVIHTFSSDIPKSPPLVEYDDQNNENDSFAESSPRDEHALYSFLRSEDERIPSPFHSDLASATDLNSEVSELEQIQSTQHFNTDPIKLKNEQERRKTTQNTVLRFLSKNRRKKLADFDNSTLPVVPGESPTKDAALFEIYSPVFIETQTLFQTTEMREHLLEEKKREEEDKRREKEEKKKENISKTPKSAKQNLIQELQTALEQLNEDYIATKEETDQCILEAQIEYETEQKIHKERVEALQKEESDMKKRLNALGTELREKMTILSELKSDTRRNEIKRLQKQEEENRTRAEFLKWSQSQSKAHINSDKDREEATQNTIQKLTIENTQLREEIDHLKTEIDSWMRKKIEKERRIKVEQEMRKTPASNDVGEPPLRASGIETSLRLEEDRLDKQINQIKSSMRNVWDSLEAKKRETRNLFDSISSLHSSFRERREVLASTVYAQSFRHVDPPPLSSVFGTVFTQIRSDAEGIATELSDTSRMLQDKTLLIQNVFARFNPTLPRRFRTSRRH